MRKLSLNIGNKLALILIAFSLVIIAMISALFYGQFDRALKERVLLQLSSVKQLKVFKIENEIKDRIEVFHTYNSDYDEGFVDSLQFRYVQFHDAIPSQIGEYPLDVSFVESLRLIDLTQSNPDLHPTIGFIEPHETGYAIGIAELSEIQEILLQRTGLGQTGESYLVGADSLLRTKSRFYSGTPWNIAVKTEGVHNALAGISSEGLFPDYRGVEVFSSYELISIHGLKWIILSEMDHQEALFPLRRLRTNLIFIMVVILVVILVVSYFLSRTIVSPVLLMERKLMTMSKGILDGVRAEQKRKDEIGRMFDALNKLVTGLSGVIGFADKIGSGNFDAQYTQLSEDDKLGLALMQMKDRLKEFQDNEQRLIKENQQSILDGQEKERARLSREMHDGLGPLLTTLRLNIQTQDFGEKQKRDLLHRIDETITEVRRMSNNLMPSVLTDFGAGEAIANLIRQMENAVPIKFRFKNDMKADSGISDFVNITLYRIAQEAINNALKHSQASEIKLSLTEFKSYISFYISDDGVGFDPQARPSGNGIRNMKERVKVANGSMDITSDDKGTTIEVEIPIK
ncbi:MAG: ATP-binding protein [Cyclobacteriaceae bacterium]